MTRPSQEHQSILNRMIVTAPSNAKSSTRPTFSCLRCAERKVKCDRKKPCSGCVKHNVECIYNATKPHRTKHKRVKVQVLADRLSQYEALLQKHGIDRHELPDLGRREVPSEASHTGSAHSGGGQSHDTPAIAPYTNQNSVMHAPSVIQSNSEFVEK
jgi:hypothetical protein